MLKALSFAFLLCFSLMGPAHAQSSLHRLMTVTSDGLEGTLDLSARVNSYDQATHLILTKREDPNYRREFVASQLARGIVILEHSGHNVVMVRSTDFNTSSGGMIILDYLSNGVNKSRQQLELQVQHDGRRWVAYHEGVAINHMFMQSRKFFGQVVGIRSVHINP